MVLVWQGVLVVVGLVFLLGASYTDIRRREVPDWLNYGLVFCGLGLRLMFSFDSGWGVFLDGVLGFLVCVGIAYLFYLANWWGGGDSKLLMGMGAVIGLGLGVDGFRIVSFDFRLGWFFLGIMVMGAVVALIWSLGLAIKKRKKFIGGFKKLVGGRKKIHYMALGLSGAFLGLSLLIGYFWPLAVVPAGIFYLVCFVKTVEDGCFVRKVKVGGLVEGDWLAKEVRVDGEKIGRKGKGLEKKDIRRMMGLFGEGKLRMVWVKEGVPFVPGFLLSYVLVWGLSFWGKEVGGLVLGILG